jgi:hypothetical protein
MMMSEVCERFQEQLIYYLDGEKTDLDVKQHLASCSVCQEKERSFRTLHHLIQGLPRKSIGADQILGSSALLLAGLTARKPPADLPHQILERINRDKLQDLPRLRRGLWPIVQTLAAAVIIIYLSFSGFSSLRVEPEKTGPLNWKININRSYYSHSLQKKTSCNHRSIKIKAENRYSALLSREGKVS